MNFSLFFSFYDHLFGNAHYEKRVLTSQDIGLNYADFPQSWWGQMKAPFQAKPFIKADVVDESAIDENQAGAEGTLRMAKDI